MSLSSKNWVFTLNCPKDMSESDFLTEFSHENMIERLKDVDYAIFQLERGALDKRLHYQGYLEISKKTSMGKVKKMIDINFIHLEIRRGTQSQARAYCDKVDTREAGPWEVGNCHEQGKRSDIAEMYDDIEEGFTVKEILHKHRHKALHILHCVEKAAKILNNCSAIDKLILKKRRRDELLLKIERCEELIRTTVDEQYEPTWKEIIDIRDLDVLKKELKTLLTDIEDNERWGIQ